MGVDDETATSRDSTTGKASSPRVLASTRSAMSKEGMDMAAFVSMGGGEESAARIESKSKAEFVSMTMSVGKSSAVRKVLKTNNQAE